VFEDMLQLPSVAEAARFVFWRTYLREWPSSCQTSSRAGERLAGSPEVGLR
jgi:hypothetical protein